MFNLILSNTGRYLPIIIIVYSSLKIVSSRWCLLHSKIIELSQRISHFTIESWLFITHNFRKAVIDPNGWSWVQWDVSKTEVTLAGNIYPSYANLWFSTNKYYLFYSLHNYFVISNSCCCSNCFRIYNLHVTFLVFFILHLHMLPSCKGYSSLAHFRVWLL